MATEWKKIFVDLRAIKYDSARLFLRQLENTLDLTKWINEGIAAGEINALSSFTLNGLTPTTQTFTTTTTGTNFTISSAGSVHSFNLPVASATNTGKLSAADWIRFDAGIVPVLGDLLSNSNAANIIGGTNAVIGGNVTIDFNAADAADDGILLSSDFNTFSAKLGSASNGLTVTSTLVELGGALTKNTTIGTGTFDFSLNAATYNFNTSLSKLIIVKGIGNTFLWHGLNTGGYDSQRFNIQNSTGIHFTNSAGSTTVFVDNATRTFGIGTTSNETTAMMTVVATGSTGLLHLKNTTSATTGGIVFNNQSDINTWRLGNYGASNSFEINYGGSGRGIFIDISGAIGFGNPATAYKCTIGSAGYANTSILQVINSISVKAYDVTSSGGIISQSWFGNAPQTQKTTASATSTFVANAGTAVNDASTFDGYTLKQVVKALRDYGLLA